MKTNEKVENAKAWQLAQKLTLQIRKAVEHVPYNEHYNFETMPAQYATQLTTSVAMALGKDKDAGYDWRYGRGQLFALRGLLLQGQELGVLKIDATLMSSLDSLQALLEDEIEKDEAAREAENTKK